MECAGNGRALLSPRPLSQPWLAEAVGTAAWRGTPLAPLLAEAGPLDDAVEVVFTGLDRGDRGRRGAGLRAQPPARGGAPRRRPPRLRDERPAAPPAARLSAPARRPGLVRDDERQVADADHGRRRALHRLPAGARVPLPPRRGRRRHAAQPHGAARADGPARDPRLPHARAHARRRGRARSRGAPGRAGRRSRRSSSAPTAARPGRRPSSTTRPPHAGPGAAGATSGTRPRASTSSAAAPATRPETPSRTRPPGTSAATSTTRCSASR